MIIHNPILTGSLELNGTSLSTGNIVTTGSNTFVGNQIVSGSILTSGSITATGTLTAQTLVVQTVTSSVVYSSGSNVFGNVISNTHQFTGSMSVSGSGTFAGSVGVGLPNPSAAFHTEVSSSTWTAKIFNTNSGSNNAGLWIKAGVNSGNEILLAQKANGTDVFLIDAGGNIGIGTNSPNAILDVRQSATNSMGISFMNTYGATSSTSQTVDIYSKLVGSGLTGQIGSLIRTGKEGDYSSGGVRDAYMSFSTAQNDVLYERMRISSEGYIKMPYQISFKAYINGTNPGAPKGTSTTFPANDTEYNIGGGYSTSTKKFTAPIAGKYLFTYYCNVYGLDDTASLNVGFQINGNSIRYGFVMDNLPTGNTGDTNVTITDIINLSAGDTVEPRISTDGSGTYYFSATLTWNGFSGHLLG